MKVVILAFGKLKTPGLRDAFEHYRKFIQPWVNLEEVELKPIAVPDKSSATRSKIQAREAELMIEKLKTLKTPRGKLYLLDERGKNQDTQNWSSLVKQWEDSSIPEVILAIGSSLGFSDEIRNRATSSLSLGPQTLSHELVRVVLAEQLFRSWSVVRGHPYHVEA